MSTSNARYASSMIINRLQRGGDGLPDWRRVSIDDLTSSVNEWMETLDALHKSDWDEPVDNHITDEEMSVMLTVHMYAMSVSNSNPRPYSNGHTFGEALAEYHLAMGDDSGVNGLNAARKIAAALSFDQRIYLLSRLVPRVAAVQAFDFTELTGDIITFRRDPSDDRPIIRWMKNFYSTIFAGRKNEDKIKINEEEGE